MASHPKFTVLLTAIAAMACIPVLAAGSAPSTPSPAATPTAVQAMPGGGGIHHVNLAASGVPAAAASQPASGVRPTIRNGNDRHATTTTQDDGGTPSNAAEPPAADQPPAN